MTADYKTKHCPHHSQQESLDLFPRDASRKDGRASVCKQGRKERRLAQDRDGSTTTLDDLRRIFGLISKDNGCITWGGVQNSKGYGVIGGYGQNKLAHRITYEWWHGEPILVGYEIDHKCRNKLCVSPLHLQALTHTEHRRVTLKRRAEARRHGCS
jgi:hypothetical protein